MSSLGWDAKDYLHDRRRDLVKAINEMVDEVSRIDAILSEDQKPVVRKKVEPRTNMERVMYAMQRRDSNYDMTTDEIVDLVLEAFPEDTYAPSIKTEVSRLGRIGRLERVSHGVWRVNAEWRPEQPRKVRDDASL